MLPIYDKSIPIIEGRLIQPKDAIIYRYLAYQQSIGTNQARSIIYRYHMKHIDTTFLISMVSGLREINSVPTFTFLLTPPSRMRSLPERFLSITSIQPHILVKGKESDMTSDEISSIIESALFDISHLEREYHNVQPILDDNIYRANDISHVQKPAGDNSPRKANAYSIAVRSETQKTISMSSSFKSPASSTTSTASSSVPPPPSSSSSSSSLYKSKSSVSKFPAQSTTATSTSTASNQSNEGVTSPLVSNTNSNTTKSFSFRVQKAESTPTNAVAPSTTNIFDDLTDRALDSKSKSPFHATHSTLSSTPLSSSTSHPTPSVTTSSSPSPAPLPASAQTSKARYTIDDDDDDDGNNGNRDKGTTSTKKRSTLVINSDSDQDDKEDDSDGEDKLHKAFQKRQTSSSKPVDSVNNNNNLSGEKDEYGNTYIGPNIGVIPPQIPADGSGNKRKNAGKPSPVTEKQTPSRQGSILQFFKKQ